MRSKTWHVIFRIPNSEFRTECGGYVNAGEVIQAMRLNRKGQGMLEYIIVIGAVMIIVIAFAVTRITPSTAAILNTANGEMGRVAGNIGNVVP